MISDRIKQRELQETEESRDSNSVEGIVPLHFQGKRKAFLDILLDDYDRGNITKEGVREEVDTFMFEVSFIYYWFFYYDKRENATKTQ